MSIGKLIFNLLIAVVVAILLFFGYKLFSGSGNPAGATPGLAPAGFATGAAGSVADEFLTTLTGLRELNLRGDVFARSAFSSLKDSNIVLPEETPGRPNPFAPINFSAFSAPAAGNNNRSATSTTTATSTAKQSVLNQLRGN